jgi:hypothetical protein
MAQPFAMSIRHQTETGLTFFVQALTFLVVFAADDLLLRKEALEKGRGE